MCLHRPHALIQRSGSLDPASSCFMAQAGCSSGKFDGALACFVAMLVSVAVVTEHVSACLAAAICGGDAGIDCRRFWCPRAGLKTFQQNLANLRPIIDRVPADLSARYRMPGTDSARRTGGHVTRWSASMTWSCTRASCKRRVGASPNKNQTQATAVLARYVLGQRVLARDVAACVPCDALAAPCLEPSDWCSRACLRLHATANLTVLSSLSCCPPRSLLPCLVLSGLARSGERDVSS